MSGITFSYLTIVEFRTVVYVAGAMRMFPCRVFVETIEIYPSICGVQGAKPTNTSYLVRNIKIEGTSYVMGANMRPEFFEPEQLTEEIRNAIECRAIAAVNGSMPGPRIDNEFDPERDEL
jgi:hypothetical protein